MIKTINNIISKNYREVSEEFFRNQTYNFIIHKYDEVILGKVIKNEIYPQKIENKSFSEQEILEMHIFNSKGEMFLVKNGQTLKAYDYLKHNNKLDNQSSNEKIQKIERYYEIENNAKTDKYDTLKTIEYVNYDDNNHMAYIEKTVLCDLIKNDNKGGK